MKMKMPKVTKFHRKLEALVGDWSGEETMFPTPLDSEGGPAKGRYKVRLDLDGFGIIQDYVQRRGGKVSYRGHGVLGYDATEKCYVWHWSDSMCGVSAVTFKGEWKRNKLVFQHAGPMGHARYSYIFHRDGTLGFSIETSADGEEWAPMMTGRYTNKKKAAAE